MTRRGRRQRKPGPAKPKAKEKPPKSRTACSARRYCSAAHNGPFYVQACIVCGEQTMQLQTVAAWDAPCCSEHNLHGDYRVRVILRPGERPSFKVERKIVLVAK